MFKSVGLKGASSTDTNHKQRSETLKQAADAKSWRLVQDTTIQLLDGSCLYEIAYQSRHYKNHIIDKGWEYLEVGFKTKRRAGWFSFGSEIVYYGVMSMELPRELPQVVFDSLKHQQRQFRLLFDPKQSIQLEGNFDEYFTTYFGSQYIIDDLSFITPEIMEVLISAGDYDIEIVHNHLLLFGSLKPDAVAQVDEMVVALHAIHAKLLHNILAYRDERVPYDQGRHIVARAGMFLDGRPLSGLSTTLLVSLFFLKIGIAAFLVCIFIIIVEKVLQAL